MVAESLAPAKLQYLQFGTDWSELLQQQELAQRDYIQRPLDLPIPPPARPQNPGPQQQLRPQDSFAQNNPWRDSEGLLDVQFNGPSVHVPNQDSIWEVQLFNGSL
jgi:hypothetical protein